MKKNDEERKIPIRRHVVLYLRVLDAESGEDIGRLGDISEKGIMVLSEKSLETEKDMRVKLKLPVSEGFWGEDVDLLIKLLWSRKDKNPKYFCQGGLILEIPEKSRHDIDKLVEKFGLADNRSLKEYTNYTD